MRTEWEGGREGACRGPGVYGPARPVEGGPKAEVPVRCREEDL